MRKTIFSAMCCILIILLFTGCSLSSQGNNLHGFTQRMNEHSENYNLTESGYIFDQKNNTLTRFFKFTDSEIMLQFECGEKNEFTCLHIVFDNSCIKNTQEMNFIKNCIEAYTESSEITNELLKNIDFENAINNISYETKKATSGDTELLLDTTAIGTVISVTRNTQ
ncbi:MAG: hypothetical protein J6D06_03585 [Clostridia bacterium]|nr:hypothetical protein [Clostridia bacterium]